MALVDPLASITDLQSAKDFFRNNPNIVLTESQLHQIIDKMGNKVAGSEVTLLYGGILKPATSTSPAVYSWQAAEEIGAKSGGKVATMGQTDVGKLLADGNFQNAVKNTATSMGITRENLLFGEDANGNRINSSSISDYASKHFSNGIEGKVQIMAGADVSPDSILSKTEFPNVIEQGKYSDIDGIKITDIENRIGELGSTGASESNIYDLVRKDILQESYTNTSSNIKFIEPDGSLSRVKGIDTRDFFGKTPDAPHINTIPSGSTNVHVLADLFDGSKLHAAENFLGKLGTAGDILAVTIAVFQANEAYAAGDTAGAIQIMEDWVAEFTIPALVAGSGEAVAARLAANDNYIDSIVRMVKIA